MSCPSLPAPRSTGRGHIVVARETSFGAFSPCTRRVSLAYKSRRRIVFRQTVRYCSRCAAAAAAAAAGGGAGARAVLMRMPA